jgi:Uncharacterised conserved protein
MFFLFSNNHLNEIISLNFDLRDEEVLAHFVTLLKATSFKLNKDSIQFFFQLDASGRCARLAGYAWCAWHCRQLQAPQPPPCSRRFTGVPFGRGPLLVAPRAVSVPAAALWVPALLACHLEAPYLTDRDTILALCRPHFPLYTEAIKLFNHPEGMVRAAVRTLCLLPALHGATGRRCFCCAAEAQQSKGQAAGLVQAGCLLSR